jgi:hypothetical protein
MPTRRLEKMNGEAFGDPRTDGGIHNQGRHNMTKDKIFIEPREEGGFSAKHQDGKRAVITGQKQKEVIAQAKSKYPDAEVHVARVKNSGPGPDKYRKA